MNRQRDLPQAKVRLPEALRTQLESEAQDRRMSLNAVIVDRLGASAGSDRTRLLAMLDLIYGRGVAGLMLLLGEIALDLAAALPNPKWRSTEGVLLDPYTFDQLRQGFVSALEDVAPAGDAAPKLATSAAATWPEWERELLEKLGKVAAGGVLTDVRSPIRRHRSERLEAIADRLGTSLAPKEGDDAR